MSPVDDLPGVSAAEAIERARAGTPLIDVREQSEWDAGHAPEARLVALACSAPPLGRACWTLRLLADRLVELEVVPAVSYETVRRTLQKTS